MSDNPIPWCFYRLESQVKYEVNADPPLKRQVDVKLEVKLVVG